MGAQLDNRGDADQAQGDGAGEQTFIVVGKQMFSKRIFAMEVVSETKVTGARLQLSGFHSLLNFQEKCAQYWPSERSARYESISNFVVLFSHLFSSAGISTLWWTPWQSTICLSTYSGSLR